MEGQWGSMWLSVHCTGESLPTPGKYVRKWPLGAQPRFSNGRQHHRNDTSCMENEAVKGLVTVLELTR